jgi:hypothetical protein
MPWEAVTTGAPATAADAGVSRISPPASVFTEHAAPGQPRALAEKYLRLSGQDLVAFYSRESPIEFSLDGRRLVLPATLAWAPRANGDLARQGLAFTVSETPFTVDPLLADYRAPVVRDAAHDDRLFDGRVVRLANLGSDGAVSFCPASYFDALATNFAMDHRPDARRETLRQFLHGGTRALDRFADSKLANHVGVVCMLETADGMLVAPRRSGNVANRPDSISASASGALDPADIGPIGADSFALSTLANAAFRETFEELGVEMTQLRFLGLLRELLRGGKPEFYFYGRTSASLQAVSPRLRKAEGREETISVTGFALHSDRVGRDSASRAAFESRVQGILNESSDAANLTFSAGVLLASTHVLRSAA